MNDITLSDIIYPELKTTSRLDHTDTNFHIWRTKLDFVLKDKQVNYVLTEPKPPKTNNPDAVARHDKWVRDDNTARLIILQTIHEYLYFPYNKHETAKSMMDNLTESFTKHSAMKKFLLFKRYKDYRMKEGTSISQHIIEMNAMAKEMELEGMDLPKQFHPVALLESLPESWQDVVTAISVNLAGDEDSDDICVKLMNAGDLKELSKSRYDDENSSRGGFNGDCYNCGEFGHRASDCPN